MDKSFTFPLRSDPKILSRMMHGHVPDQRKLSDIVQIRLTMWQLRVQPMDGSAPTYSVMVHEVHTAFFSYCREDSEFALKLAEDLKSAGAHVWIDQLDIEPGTPWDRAVEDALTNSPRMLVVLSPVSVNSDNVRDEVSFALSRQKRVIPVLYRDCNVPFRLARLQHIDFRPDYQRALKVLLRALGVEILLEAPAASAAIVAAEAAVSTAEAEENARQQKLEAARKLAAEQAELEAARKLAAEQARQEQQRKAAAEKSAREQLEREAADEKPHNEKLRREQRAAEQARLEAEARQAEEKARLVQQEQERLAAELRARQEQLRREQQESVERRSLDLAQLEREQHEREAAREAPPEETPRQAVEPAPVEQPPKAEPTAKPAPSARDEALTAGFNFASPKFLAGAAVLLVVVGLIVFFATHRGSPPKPQESVTANKAPESAAVQQPTAPAPKEQAPAGTPSQTTQPPTPAETPTQQEQAPLKTPSPGASAAPTKPPANAAAPAAPVKVSQGVSHALLIHEVKPDYPPLARQAHVQGTVVLAVVIAKDGSIKSIHALNGHPMLVPAAIDAVKQWRYKPYMLNGKPVDVDTSVAVNFRLTN